MEMESDVRFTVTYNKQPVEVSFDSLDAATVGDLKRRLAELTGVPIENQKLMLKGMLKDDSKTLAQVGVKEGAKVMMVGVSRDERQKVEALAAPKPLYELRNPQDREHKEPEVVPKKKRFHYINTLPLPRAEVAQELLERIAADVGISGVMELYGWNVLYLKELSLNQEDKLGWNVNQGLEISLRLRVDKDHQLEFRSYEEIKDVMVHELTHMHIGPHDASFYAFNRLLHQQIADIERKEAAKSQKWYDVMQEAEKKSGYKLGGVSAGEHLAHRPQDLALQAALGRISAREQAITDGCGGSIRADDAEKAERAADAKSEQPHQHTSQTTAAAAAAAASSRDTHAPSHQRQPEATKQQQQQRKRERETERQRSEEARQHAATTGPAAPATSGAAEQGRAVGSAAMPAPETAPQWACPACTYLNRFNRPSCEMCMTDNPAYTASP